MTGGTGQGGQGWAPGQRQAAGNAPAPGSGGSGGPALTAAVECHDDVCVTCSDTAVPVTIVRLLGDDLALVATGSGEEEVSVAFVSARAGDTILVHAGEAIAVVGS
jgi:hydrogenase expression/formation protein HypC